jgi:hypothetical protein
MGSNVIPAPSTTLTGQAGPYSVTNPLGQKTWTQYFKGSLPVNDTAHYLGGPIKSRIIYGNGIYAFVNFSGIVFYSTDAKTWNTQIINSGTNIYAQGIAYGNNIWVVVCQSGVLYSGTPGGTWTARTSQYGSNASIYDVKWISGLNLFITCGTPSAAGQTAITSSPDGINWTNRLNDPNSQAEYSNIGYDPSTNTVAVSCGNSTNNIYYSTNGTSWTAVNTGYQSYQVQFLQGALGRWVATQQWYSTTSANIGSTWYTQNPKIFTPIVDNNKTYTGNVGSYPRSYWEMQYDSVNNYYYQLVPPNSNSTPMQLVTYDASTIQTTYYSSTTSYYQTYPIIKSEVMPLGYLGNNQTYGYVNGVHIFVLWNTGADFNTQIFTTA